MAQFLARLRTLFAVLFNRRPRLSTPAFHRLLERAGIPRSVDPRLLEVAQMAGLRLEGEEGDGDKGGDDDGDADSDGDDDGADSGDDDNDEDEDDDGKEKDADYWRKQHRRYERTVKRKRERDKKELKEAQDKLKKLEDADKSEQEKAVEKAKEEGRNEALTEAEKERRADRLESACVRQAAKRIEIGEGDDKRKVRFEDPEDAEVFLQRKITNGDLDAEELFDDNGKVKPDVLTEALKEILEDKPRLAEESEEGKKKTPKGSADGGRGEETGGKVDMNDFLRRGT